MTYTYDQVGNVTGVTNALGAPVAWQSGTVSYSFEHDALDRLVVARGSVLSRPGVEDRFSALFQYSDIHNLVRKQQVREVVTRTGAERPERTNHDDAYVYAGWGPHQATHIGDVSLEYDLSGNTLAECRSPQGLPCDTAGPGGEPGGDVSQSHLRRYTWNEEHRLAAVVDGGGRSATRFLYDSAGERVVKLGTGATSLTVGPFFSVKGRQHATKHIFAGASRIASKLLPTPEGQVGILGGGRPVPPGQVGNGHGCEPSGNQPGRCPEPEVGPVAGEAAGIRPATYYYHADHLGSAGWMTDQRGRVYEHVEYFPYGEVWREERGDSRGGGEPEPTFRFTGKPYDEETGLTYFGSRYYDARKARWLSADPALVRVVRPNPVLLSAYAYGYGNPLRYVDPNGEEPIDYVKGGAMGLVASLLPASWALPRPPEGLDPDFYVAYAGAFAATGTVEMYIGVSQLTGGTGMAVGGASVGAAGASTGVGAPVAAGGAVVAAGGVAVAAQGVLITAEGALDLQTAFTVLQMARQKDKRVPNPYGSRGGPEHRQKIKERIEELKKQGYIHMKGGDKKEEVLKIRGGHKSKRRPDITMRAPDGRMHRENVGLQTKGGQPIERERKALEDIERATGERPVFTPYNKIE